MDLLRTFLNLHPSSKPSHKSNPRIAKEITSPPPPESFSLFRNNPVPLKRKAFNVNDLDVQPRPYSESSKYRRNLMDMSEMNYQVSLIILSKSIGPKKLIC
jgi:hypothetical protein